MHAYLVQQLVGMICNAIGICCPITTDARLSYSRNFMSRCSHDNHLVFLLQTGLCLDQSSCFNGVSHVTASDFDSLTDSLASNNSSWSCSVGGGDSHQRVEPSRPVLCFDCCSVASRADGTRGLSGIKHRSHFASSSSIRRTSSSCNPQIWQSLLAKRSCSYHRAEAYLSLMGCLS